MHFIRMSKNNLLACYIALEPALVWSDTDTCDLPQSTSWMLNLGGLLLEAPPPTSPTSWRGTEGRGHTYVSSHYILTYILLKNSALPRMLWTARLRLCLRHGCCSPLQDLNFSFIGQSSDFFFNHLARQISAKPSSCVLEDIKEM